MLRDPTRCLAALAVSFGVLIYDGARAQEDRSQGRSVVMSRFGVVAAEHPLAAQAGATVLAHGGSAVDAAVAANAVMGVVAPMMNGMGGDLVAMVYNPRTGSLVGLDAIGWSPGAASIARVERRDGDRVEAHAMDAVTVPGAVDGWDRLLRRFGRKSFGEVLAPAISLAESGFPVSASVTDSGRPVDPAQMGRAGPLPRPTVPRSPPAPHDRHREVTSLQNGCMTAY